MVMRTIGGYMMEAGRKYLFYRHCIVTNGLQGMGSADKALRQSDHQAGVNGS